jgi:hypothetical protein
MAPSEQRQPDIVVSYSDIIPDELMQPFTDAVTTPAVAVSVHRRESLIFAGVEWLLPTAAFLYVAKSYFDAMLKEAGKEHYHILKAKLPLLWEKFFSRQRAIHVTAVVSGAAKVEATPTFSRAMSLMAEGPDGLVIKLLLHDGAAPHELDAAVDRFFAFLADYHRGVVAERIAQELRSIPPSGRQVLVARDPETGDLSVVDPRPPKHQGKHGV